MTVSATRQAFTRPEQHEWFEKLARFGHVAKGVVYGLIGVLALQVAFGSGGQLADGQDAARFVDQQPFGQVLLALIGIGLVGYAAWRAVAAIKDTQGEGHGGKGIAKRVGYAASALANGALAVTAFQLAFNQGGGGGGQQTWLTQIMAAPAGQFIVALIGLGILARGAQQLWSAYTAKFTRELKTQQMSATERTWAVRVGRAGLAARGVVFGIIGVAVLNAAAQHDPGQAKGIGEALADIGSSPFGTFMLIVVAAGLVAYGAHMLFSAKYRRLGAH